MCHSVLFIRLVLVFGTHRSARSSYMLEWSYLALLPVSDTFSKFVRMKTLSHLVVAKSCSLCSCDALSQVELPETLVAPLSQESNITERYEPFT